MGGERGVDWIAKKVDKEWWVKRRRNGVVGVRNGEVEEVDEE